MSAQCGPALTPPTKNVKGRERGDAGRCHGHRRKHHTATWSTRIFGVAGTNGDVRESVPVTNRETHAGHKVCHVAAHKDAVGARGRWDAVAARCEDAMHVPRRQHSRWSQRRGQDARPLGWSRWHGCRCGPTSQSSAARTARSCRAAAGRTPSHMPCICSPPAPKGGVCHMRRNQAPQRQRTL